MDAAPEASVLLELADSFVRQDLDDEAIANCVRAAEFFVAHRDLVAAAAAYTKGWRLVTSRKLRLPSAHLDIPHILAEMHVERGAPSEAIAVLENAARFHTWSGTHAEAVRALRTAVRLHYGDTSLRLRLASALIRAEDTSGAVLEYSVVIRMLVTTGRSEDALSVIERLLAHEPDPSFARLAAELYLRRANAWDAAQALKHLRLCLRADREDVESLRLLARALRLVGQHRRVSLVEDEIDAIAARRGGFVVRSSLLPGEEGGAATEEAGRPLETAAAESAPEEASLGERPLADAPSAAQVVLMVIAVLVAVVVGAVTGAWLMASRGSAPSLWPASAPPTPLEVPQ